MRPKVISSGTFSVLSRNQKDGKCQERHFGEKAASECFISQWPHFGTKRDQFRWLAVAILLAHASFIGPSTARWPPTAAKSSTMSLYCPNWPDSLKVVPRPLHLTLQADTMTNTNTSKWAIIGTHCLVGIPQRAMPQTVPQGQVSRNEPRKMADTCSTKIVESLGKYLVKPFGSREGFGEHCVKVGSLSVGKVKFILVCMSYL